MVDLVPRDTRVYPVGRLDADSEGLIILTNDGDLTGRVTHPRHGVTKTYLARVTGYPRARRRCARLLAGSRTRRRARPGRWRRAADRPQRSRTLVEVVMRRGPQPRGAAHAARGARPRGAGAGARRHRSDSRPRRSARGRGAGSPIEEVRSLYSGRRDGDDHSATSFAGPDGPFRATVAVPGDKSLSHRALVLAAMASGASRSGDLGPGADVASTAAALRPPRGDGRSRDASIRPASDAWRRPAGPDRRRQLRHHDAPAHRSARRATLPTSARRRRAR